MLNHDIKGTAGVALLDYFEPLEYKVSHYSTLQTKKLLLLVLEGLVFLTMRIRRLQEWQDQMQGLVFLLDKNGLVTKERAFIDSAATPFAKDVSEVESFGLTKGFDLRK
ncbi:hypothetical protein LXL04_033816 [Taraxacum kok-saghyz]